MMDWQSKLQAAQPSQAVHDWWGDWYKKSVQSNENINAMPFVFNSSGGQNNPMGIGPMMDLIKGMTSPGKSMPSSDPAAQAQALRLQSAQQGGGLTMPGVTQDAGGLAAPADPGGDLLQQLLGLSPEALMPLLQQIKTSKGLV